MKNEMIINLRIITVVFLMGLLSIQSASAQSVNREVGIRLYGLNDFDFISKKELSDNMYRRTRFVFTNLGYQSISDQSSFTFQGGFAVGGEKRKLIAEDLLFIHGLEPSLLFNLSIIQEFNSLDLMPAIGYVLGFQYDMFPRFSLNLETIPTLSTAFSFDDDERSNDFSINAGFASNAVALSLVYRFKSSK